MLKTHTNLHDSMFGSVCRLQTKTERESMDVYIYLCVFRKHNSWEADGFIGFPPVTEQQIMTSSTWRGRRVKCFLP